MRRAAPAKAPGVATREVEARAATTGEAPAPPDAAGQCRRSAPVERSRVATLVVVGTLVAFSLWLESGSRLGVSSLWFDDTWTAVSTRLHGLANVLPASLTSPGYTLLLRMWTGVFGHTSAGYQSLAFTFAAIAVPLCFFVSRRWGARLGPATVAAAVLATAPQYRVFAASVKQYTGEAVATLVLLWACAFVTDRAVDKRRWYVLLGACTAATLYSTSETVIAAGVLAAGTYAYIRQRRSTVPRLPLLVVGTYAIGALVWYLTAVRPHLDVLVHDFWKPAFVSWDRGVGTVPAQVYERLHAVAAGFSWADPRLSLVILLCGGVLLAVRRPVLAVAIWTSIAMAVALAALQLAPLGGGRTDVYLFPLLAITVGNGLDEAVSMLGRRSAVVAGTACAVAAIVWLAASTQRVVPRYTLEDTRPLVHLVERARRPGDLTVVYPPTNFAYGLYTRYSIDLVRDDRYQTSFFVRPRDPHTMVLPMERDHPDRYARAVEAIAAPRVWLIGSHFSPDWNVIRDDFERRGYRPIRRRAASHAELILYARVPAERG